MLISWFEFSPGQLCSSVIVKCIRLYLLLTQELCCLLDVNYYHETHSSLILEPSDWVHPSASSSSGRALSGLKRNNPHGDDGGMSFMGAQCLITGLPPADSLSLGSNGRWGKNDSLAWIRAYKQPCNCWETSRISGAPYETDEMGDILYNKGVIVLHTKTEQEQYCYSMKCLFSDAGKIAANQCTQKDGDEQTHFINSIRGKKTSKHRI